ncbi:MAG: hypothetical protein CMP22_06930 [Rickettsiales bacterium]|nr:hypothetical protein [Rickettsiales bacterium]
MQNTIIKNNEARTGFQTENKLEIQQLFLDHIYGDVRQPDVTPTFEKKELGVKLFRKGAKARFEEVTIFYGEKNLKLLLIKPIMETQAKLPCFLFLNSRGNHTVTNCKFVPKSTAWAPKETIADKKQNKYGGHQTRFDVESMLKNGYIVATIHESNIAVDNKDLNTDGCVIARWADGLSRCVDYLVTDTQIDNNKIAVTGFSRRAKAATLATALDERIALLIAHQSGTGGLAPSLKIRAGAETVEQINEKFPHWFNERFKSYNSSENLPPVEQFDLFALISPRPVLATSARDDIWSDPVGTFGTMKAATKYYEASHVNPCPQAHMDDMPVLSSPLCYFLRDGDHGITHCDWAKFIDFANTHFK